jgi:hypothetical protein
VLAALSLRGDRNALVKWGQEWWPVGLIIMAIGIGLYAYVSFRYHSTLMITGESNLGLRIHITEPGAAEKIANGKWKWYAYYTVHPQKYGMEKRECHLVLFSKDKAFCELRQDLGTLTQKPAAEFAEFPAMLTLSVPVYRTKHINEILACVKSSAGAEQIRPDYKSKQAAKPAEAPTAAPVQKSPVDQSQPQYGDPDYDL